MRAHGASWRISFAGSSILLVLSSLWMAGCRGDTGGRRLVTQVEASDSAGVVRVHILDLFELRVPEVEARRVWVSDDADLNAVRDAWIESDGSVLLANSGSSEIVRLGPGGELVARLGSTGEGPGELAPFGLNWIDGSREGRIVAYDERLARITVLGLDGAVLETHRVAPASYGTFLQPMALLPGDRILATYGDVRRFDREGRTRDTLPLLSVAFGGVGEPGEPGGESIVDTLGLWLGPERAMVPTPAGMVRIPVGFGNDLLYHGAGPVAAVSPTDAVDLRVFSDGRLVATVEAGAPPRPVRAEDAEALREDLAARAPDSRVEELWRDAPVNEIYPTLDRLVVTRDGSVWIGIHPEYREARRTFILLGRRGFPVGRLRIPRDVEILAATNDSFVASTRSELDGDRIGLWRIE